MPNCNTHKLAGGLSGATYAAYKSSGQPQLAQLLEVIGGSAAGVYSGQLPDMLEPAYSPCHRAFCHSVTFGAGVVYLGSKVVDAWQATLRRWADEFAARRPRFAPGSVEALGLLLAESLCRLLAGAIAGLFAGYTSHLVLDACTPLSIKLI